MRLEEEENGNYLVLAQVSPGDTGQYSCQLSSYKPTQLLHSLSVRGEYQEIFQIPTTDLTMVEFEEIFRH